MGFNERLTAVLNRRNIREEPTPPHHTPFPDERFVTGQFTSADIIESYQVPFSDPEKSTALKVFTRIGTDGIPYICGISPDGELKIRVGTRWLPPFAIGIEIDSNVSSTSSDDTEEDGSCPGNKFFEDYLRSGFR